MDPALRKLLRLRFRGMLRRAFRGLKTVRGVVFTLLGVAMLTLWLGPHLMTAGSVRGKFDPQEVRTVVPLVLLGLCLLGVIRGKRGIYFSGAEIDFLFSGPFTRRELLVYRLFPLLSGALFTALIFSAFFLAYVRLWAAGVVGFWLSLVFVQLFSTALVLIGQTVTERAYTRVRRLTLGGVILAVGLGLWWAALHVDRGGLFQVVQRFHDSWPGRLLLAPFDVFGRAITAETLFPELLGWGAIALAVDLALLAVVLRLDVNYVETSIAVSQKLYQQIERVRRRGGVVWTGKPTARVRLPQLPWLGGAGPIIRRQLTQAVRSAPGVVLFLVVMAIPLGAMTVAARDMPKQTPLAFLCSMLAFMTVMFTRMVPFDFRGDVDQIEWLKALPLSSTAIAAGQIVVPALIMTGFHWLVLGSAIVLAEGLGSVLVVMGACAVPFNFLLFCLENLLFLWFPARLMPAAPGDLQHAGRAMVEVMVKMFVLFFCCGLAAGVGGAAYFLSGGSWLAAILLSWTALAMIGAMFVPLVGLAYRRFDVSLHTPP